MEDKSDVERFSTSGTLQIWDYAAGLSQLNLRLPRARLEDPTSENVDLIFMGVTYVELPYFLQGLYFDQASDAEIVYLRARCRNHIDNRQFFVLVSSQQRYYVVAARLFVERNTLPPTISGLEDMARREVEGAQRIERERNRAV